MRRSLSCQAPVKYRVLGVAAVRSLQETERAGTARERGEFGFQFVTRRPFEVFAYNDVDAASNIGQLPLESEKKMPSYAG